MSTRAILLSETSKHTLIYQNVTIMIITLMLIFSPLIVTETVLTISYNIQISTNGYLTFGSPNSRCCPPSSAEGVDIDYLVSPFWTNFDNGLGGIILYQAIADSDAIDALNGYISGDWHQFRCDMGTVYYLV